MTAIVENKQTSTIFTFNKYIYSETLVVRCFTTLKIVNDLIFPPTLPLPMLEHKQATQRVFPNIAPANSGEQQNERAPEDCRKKTVQLSLMHHTNFFIKRR